MTPAATAGLGAAVFFAGWVDALAGGGGLISLPAYLAAGLDPALALGTNKLSSSIGTVASTARYGRAVRLPWRPFLPVVAAALASSWAGARLAMLVDPAWIRPLLLAALPATAWLVWSRKDFGAEDASARHAPRALLARSLAVAAPAGAYDGFFGPGTGTFLALGFSKACGFDLLGATARAKAINLASNLSALAAFAWAGRLDWRLGLAMSALSVAGHWTGSRLGLRRGAAAIRPAVLLVCGLLFLKILADAVRAGV